MFDFETDYIEKTNGFLKRAVMLCSFCNSLLIPRQNIRISERPYHNSASLVRLLAAERPEKKREKTTGSKILVFTVFQNTATAVNHNISSKQMTPERLLSAECS